MRIAGGGSPGAPGHEGAAKQEQKEEQQGGEEQSTAIVPGWRRGRRGGGGCLAVHGGFLGRSGCLERAILPRLPPAARGCLCEPAGQTKEMGWLHGPPRGTVTKGEP